MAPVARPRRGAITPATLTPWQLGHNSAHLMFGWASQPDPRHCNYHLPDVVGEQYNNLAEPTGGPTEEVAKNYKAVALAAV